MKRIMFSVGILIFLGCNQFKKSDGPSENGISEEGTVQIQGEHPGKVLLEKECYVCHNPKSTRADMIAPPMIAIKKHYIDGNTGKEDFSEALIQWVNDPEAETKMPGAHKTFGSMPYLPYSDDAIRQIAEYMYDYEIEKPEWFEAHYKEAHHKTDGIGGCQCLVFDEEPETIYGDIGMEYARQAKTALGKNLIRAIQNKGTVGAIGFCNTHAIRLTDSLSTMKNAVIQRVSDKPRNQDNRATEEELRYVDFFKRTLSSGNDVQPVVNISNGEVDFYYPIITNGMCLQCHGKPTEQIVPETLGALKKMYPDDEAIGYGENEVRGIWSIKFEANTTK